jgi:hypothetical protein
MTAFGFASGSAMGIYFSLRANKDDCMRTMLVLLGAITLLVNCSTSMAESDLTSLQRWVGQSSKALIAKMGAPDYRYTSPNGNTVLSYTIKRYYSPPPAASPQIGVNSAKGRTVIITNPPAFNQNQLNLTCNVLFQVNRDGVVVSMKKNGAGCD